MKKTYLVFILTLFLTKLAFSETVFDTILCTFRLDPQYQQITMLNLTVNEDRVPDFTSEIIESVRIALFQDNHVTAHDPNIIRSTLDPGVIEVSHGIFLATTPSLFPPSNADALPTNLRVLIEIRFKPGQKPDALLPPKWRFLDRLNTERRGAIQANTPLVVTLPLATHEGIQSASVFAGFPSPLRNLARFIDTSKSHIGMAIPIMLSIGYDAGAQRTSWQEILSTDSKVSTNFILSTPWGVFHLQKPTIP